MYMSKKKNVIKITIPGGHRAVKMDDIHEFNSRVNTGCGCHGSKKGKGSYTRKDKHKGQRPERNWD